MHYRSAEVAELYVEFWNIQTELNKNEIKYDFKIFIYIITAGILNLYFNW